MTRRLHRNLAATLALAGVTLASSGCYAGYGGHGGYGGYTRVSGGGHWHSSCRVSGGAEEFLAYAIFYGGIIVIAGVVELVEWVGDNCG